MQLLCLYLLHYCLLTLLIIVSDPHLTGFNPWNSHLRGVDFSWLLSSRRHVELFCVVGFKTQFHSPGGATVAV